MRFRQEWKTVSGSQINCNKSYVSFKGKIGLIAFPSTRVSLVKSRHMEELNNMWWDEDSTGPFMALYWN